VKERDLKQIEAANLLGIKQPDGYKILVSELRQFSVRASCVSSWRSIRDVEIMIEPHRDTKNVPVLHVS